MVTKRKSTTPGTDPLPEWVSDPTEEVLDGPGEDVVLAEPDVGGPGGGALQDLMDWCHAAMEAGAADSAAAMAREVSRILGGEDAEAVLASAPKPLPGREHTGKPFILVSFAIQPTDFSDGWPFYAVLECEAPASGGRFTMTCGGPKVIAALCRLAALDALPCPVQLEGKQTKAGHTVLSLVRPDA